MGIADRVVRLILVITLVTLYFTGIISGLLGTIALVAAGIFTLTSLVSFCPIYALFGASTCKVDMAPK